MCAEESAEEEAAAAAAKPTRAGVKRSRAAAKHAGNCFVVPILALMGWDGSEDRPPDARPNSQKLIVCALPSCFYRASTSQASQWIGKAQTADSSVGKTMLDWLCKPLLPTDVACVHMMEAASCVLRIHLSRLEVWHSLPL